MIHWIALFLLITSSLLEASNTHKEKISLGIFAYRPVPIMHQNYDPIIRYLNENLSSHYIDVKYLSMDELDLEIQQNKLDIIFTTPSQYIRFRHTNALASTFATLIRKGTSNLATLGGVIVTKASREDINTLADVKDKKIATPGKKFFGGYAIQVYEFYEADIDIASKATIIETMTHDNALNSLLHDESDVAFIRTGLIEQFIKEGRIKGNELKVINAQDTKSFPYLVSTKLYPEWPLVALPHVDNDFLRELSALIFSLTPDSEVLKKVNIAGFVPAKDYLSVERVFKALRLPPFNIVDDFTSEDILKKYKYQFTFGSLFFILFIILFFVVLKQNRELILSRKKLEEEQNKYKLVDFAVNNVQEAMYLIDQTANFFYVNSGALKQLGYSQEELFNMSVFDLDGDLPKDQWNTFWETLVKEKNLKFEAVHTKKDGTKFDVEVEANLFVYNGETYNLGLVRDITERKKLQLELQEERNRFSLAVEGAQDGLWDWNLQTNEVVLSERFETMLDYNYGDLPQTEDAWFGLLHPDDMEKASKAVKEYLDSKGEKNYESTFRLRAKDGSWRWILGRGKALFSEDGTALRLVGFNTDITERMEYQDKLDHTAKHDSLTQLPNRFLLSELLTQMMHNVKRNKKKLAYLFIDLDGFKEVNDTYGHDAGDEVLTAVSLRMSNVVRESDIVARLGGDEFVIVASELENSSEVVPLLQRLLTDISSTIFFNNHEMHVSASIGVSFYPQQNDIGTEVLLRQADQAMYSAKNLGKNQYQFFDIEASRGNYGED